MKIKKEIVMELENVQANVVCDIAGCNNVAKVFIKKDKATLSYDSLKLCPCCAGGIIKVLQKVMVIKEKKDADNK